MKNIRVAIVAAVMALSATTASALFGGGGMGGGIWDYANYLENAKNAVSSAAMEARQIRELEEKIRANMRSVRDVTNLGDTLNRVTNLKQSLSYLEGKIGSSQSVYTQAKAMYGAGNHSSWAEFGQAIQRRSQAGEASASSLVRSAELAKRQLEEANDAHTRIAQSIEGAQGVTEAAQATASATAVVIDQNNALLGLISASNAVQGSEMAKKQAQQTASEEAAKAYGENKKSQWDAFKARAGL